MTPTLALSLELLAEPSITPDDKDCQNILAQRLKWQAYRPSHCQSL